MDRDDSEQREEQEQIPPEAERETTRLWRIWKTVHEMLIDRGYLISDRELQITRLEFWKRYHDRTTNQVDRELMKIRADPSPEMITRDTPRPTKKDPTPLTKAGNILVSFIKETPLGVKHVRAFGQLLLAQNFSNGILISVGHAQAATLKLFEAMLGDQGITAEHFQEQELLVNITKHDLVPKHILLSDEEKKVLLDRYRLKETQLPRIQSTDPVARFLGLKKRQVVKIIRKSETAGRYASYRWVY